MKKLFILLSFFMAVTLHGQIIFQSSFETWNGGVPDGWNGSQTSIGVGNYLQYTTSAQSGTSACQLINTSSTHKRFTTSALPIVSGQSYDITFWVRGQGEIRTGLFNGVDAAQNTYQSYITVNSTTWTMHKQMVTSNETNNNGQFIFSLRNSNAAQDHIQIDNITIEYSTTSIDTVSIYDIQYTTDATGNSPYMNQSIYTYGIVTAKGTAGFFIQDSTKAWNGLYIFNNTFTVNPGDSVLILGTIVEYFNMTEMSQVTSCQILGTTQIPAPAIITTAQVNTEAYESVFVKVINAQCTALPNANAEWTVNDGSGLALVNDLMYAFVPTLNVYYNVTGPVNYSFSQFKIEPRSAADVEIYTSVQETFASDIFVFPNPTSDFVKISVPSESKIQIMNLLGQTLYASALVTGEMNINISDWENGIYIIQVNEVNGKTFASKLIKK
jgi:hypothetical protein